MNIAHIITDEKFPDSAYEMFEEVCPGCNTFILPGKKAPIKNLKKIDPIRIGKYSFLNRRLVSWINEFDALIIHGMNSFSLELVNRCKSSLKIYWIGMGFDYYDIIFKKKEDLLKPRTKQTVLESRKSNFFYKSVLRNILRVYRDRLLYPHSSDKKAAVRRVDYFCPVLESEFYSVKSYINCWNAEYVDWNYGNSATVVDGKYGQNFSLGNDILLGNSASPNNNHLDSLWFLKENEDYLRTDGKIIVPLSYGDFRYREIVVCRGNELFGERFVPLTEFVSPEDYSNILRGCGLVFMNHLRQQAGNNIAQALFMGARVVLDSKNPFYNDYKKHGVSLTSLEEAEENPGLLSKSLTNEEVAFNQDVLKKMRGSRVAISKTKKLIKSIHKQNIS